MQDGAEWDRLDQCLAKATSETFETMCFSSAEPACGQSAEIDAFTAQQVEFQGDAAGRLRLAMNADTARWLAANFYGQDEESLEDFQVEAVVSELTNVVCGSMLSLFSPTGNFSLSTPEPSNREGFGAPESLDRVFRLEPGSVFLSVSRKFI